MFDFNKKNNEKKNEQQGTSLTSMMLIIRVVIGAYLMYMGYDLITGIGENVSMRWAFMLVGGVFIVFGFIAAILGLKDMIKGRYKGGFGDTSEKDKPEEKSLAEKADMVKTDEK